MLFVIAIHALNHGGLNTSAELRGFSYIAIFSTESLVIVANNCFILISAYFLVESKSKPSRLVNLELQVLFYSIITTVVYYAITGNNLELSDIQKAIFPITSSMYWFATQYFLLVLVSPWINKLIQSITQRQHMSIIVLLFTIFCIIPTVFFWSKKYFCNGQDISHLVTLYFIAAYIRNYAQKRNPLKSIAAYLICALLTTLCCLVVEFTTSIKPLKGLTVLSLFENNMLFITLGSVCLFSAFRNIKVKSIWLSRVILFIAPLSFGVYLFHDNQLIRTLIWKVLNMPAALDCGVPTVLGYLVIVVLGLYTVGCIIDYIRALFFKIIKVDKIAGFVDKKFPQYTDRLLNRIVSDKAWASNYNNTNKKIRIK